MTTTFIPSTTVAVQRGVLAANEFGDELPATTSVATGLPAAVQEKRQRSYQPAEQRGGVVEEFTIRLRPTADVTEDDRLVDERTGAVYQVRTIHHPRSVVGLADVRVTAVRTGAASLPVNG